MKELRAGYVIVDSLLKISSLKPESAKLHNLTPVEVRRGHTDNISDQSLSPTDLDNLFTGDGFTVVMWSV